MGERINNNYTTKEGVSHEAPSLFRCISVGNLSYFVVTMAVVSMGRISGVIELAVMVSVDLVTVMLSAGVGACVGSDGCWSCVGAMCMSS